MLDVVAIFGPTGVGKTAVAIELAALLREAGEDPVAVSADALQIYRGLEVLTGAADAAEQSRLEHRLLSFVPVSDSFSAGRYARLAHDEIDRLRAAGRRPIVVGGTGLYLRAALTELALKPPVPPEVRAQVRARLQQHGPEALHGELKAAAPKAAATIAPTDSQRITRALELVAVGEDPQVGDQLWTEHTRVPTRLFGLTLERELLRQQIDRRVEAMLEAGALEEVRAAAGAGPSARKAVGFQELLDGDVAQMKTRTWQYARRQLTWMRKLASVHLIDLSERSPADAAAAIAASLRAP
ncbi:MAG: tRNA (adenosine(37)-N6)-dimethylallyltransferase MiaA [Solirubrobacterales bacterium]|nr:tRNA (adenosine(37)-N6)-dimethylallyltransferase MiaA [Solirubrobacterales bacterium]